MKKTENKLMKNIATGLLCCTVIWLIPFSFVAPVVAFPALVFLVASIVLEKRASIAIKN